MTEPIVTEEGVRGKLRHIVRRFGSSSNPVDALGRTLYTYPHNPSRHCIVGRLAVEEGWDLPPVGDQMFPVGQIAFIYR